jgi:glycosyltransferase involved in cell wall biosynthesis
MGANSTPLVSVLMPVYNVAAWVQSAVDSILRQTYPNFELLVLDDGSTDATLSILGDIRDQRMRILALDHVGLFSILNRGIMEARGELIARMDGDDLSHQERLQRQVALFQQYPNCACCGSNFGYLTPNGRVASRRLAFEDRKLTKSLITQGMTSADASMIYSRASALEAGLYDVDQPINEKSLFYKILQSHEGYEIGACLYFVRFRLDSASTTGGAHRGRGARLRYDPEGFQKKYWNKLEPPSDQELRYRKIRQYIAICRVTRDYASALKAVVQTHRSLNARYTLKLLWKSVRRRSGPNLPSSLKPAGVGDFQPYQAESRTMVESLRQLGIRVDTR